MSEPAEVAELPVEGGADNELDVTAPGVDAGAVEPAEGDSGDDAAAADDDADVFSFSDADAESDAQGEGEDAEGGEDVFAFSEGSKVPADYTEAFAGIAKEVGVGGKAAAALIERAWEYAVAQDKALNKELGGELRKEWGSEFDAKVAATKTFAVRLAERAGLSMEAMKPMMSPYGFKLINAMRELVQEGGGFAGGAKSEPKLTAEQQIDQIYETPELFRALTEPGDPRHDEINARLNKLMGIR